MSFTIKQRIFIVRYYYETRSYKIVSKDFKNEFNNVYHSINFLFENSTNIRINRLCG